MKRVQVADLQRALLEPQARPVDAYERAGGVDPSQGLRALADSLSSVQPTLRHAFAKQDKADQEDALLRAQRDRMKNQMTFAEGVEAGVISEGENPYYVQAYKRLDGRFAGRQEYSQQVSQAYEQSGLAYQNFNTEAERQTALADFLQGQREQFLQGKDDKYWIDGAADGINQAEAQFSQRYMQDVANVNAEAASMSMQKAFGEFLYSEGTVEQRGAMFTQFARENMGQFGLSGSKVNETMINSIQSEAKTLALAGKYQEAFDALEVMDHIETSQGNSLGSTNAGRQALNQAAAFIEQRQKDQITWNQSQISWEWRKADHAFSLLGRDRTVQEWAAQDSTNAALTEILANPMDPALLDNWRTEAKANPEFAKSLPSLIAYRNARINAEHVVLEEPSHITGLRIAAQDGRLSSSEIAKEVENHTLSPDTAAELIRTISAGAAAKDKIDRLPASHRKLIEDKLAILKRQTMGTDMIPGQGGAPVFADQMYIWTSSMNEFLDQNPNPSMQEINTFTAQLLSDAMEANPNIMGQAATAPDQLGKTFNKPQAQPQEQPAQQFEQATPATVAKARANPELIPAFEARFGPISNYQ